MNVYDSSRISGLLEESGFPPEESPENSDVLVLNTCHIREKASDKIFSELGLIRRMKETRAAEGRPLLVGVAGCVAQAEGAEILRRETAVDFVMGPQSYHRLPEALARAKKGERPLLIDFETKEKFRDLDQRAVNPLAAPHAARRSAFLTVQEGCDKFCSFCVVPYTRGAEVSRSASEIIREAEKLARVGVRDITLLGQNVNAYRWRDGARVWTLADLFAELAKIPEIFKLRYMTSHPLDMGEDLIAAHGAIPKLAPYLHLPVQSGSDAILRAMNRRHTARHYRAVIAKVRAARPDIAFSSDFIVGYPGETEDDFQATLDLVEDVFFASAYSFRYSPRPGTPSANSDNNVPEDIQKNRLQRLQKLLDAQRLRFNTECIGRTFDILFEKTGLHPGQITGRSPYMQSVQVDGPQTLIGTVQSVRIERLGSNSLYGRIVSAIETNEVRS